MELSVEEDEKSHCHCELLIRVVLWTFVKFLDKLNVCSSECNNCRCFEYLELWKVHGYKCPVKCRVVHCI